MRVLGSRLGKAATGVSRSRVNVVSIVGGLITATIVAAIGLALVAFRAQMWTATSSLVVLPNADGLSQQEAASYYDTLSRGQISATFAQIIQSQSTPVRQPGNVGLTEDQAKLVNVAVIAVPNTAIINVKVDAPTADQAARVASGVAEAGQSIVRQLKTPYTATVVDSAAPVVAQPVGPSTLTLGFVVAIVAVVAGVGAQQVLWLLGLGRAHHSAGAVASDRAPPAQIDGKPLAADDQRSDSGHPHPPAQNPANVNPTVVKRLT